MLTIVAPPRQNSSSTDSTLRRWVMPHAKTLMCELALNFRYAATSTILISASLSLRSAHLERVAHYRKFSEARDYTIEVRDKSVRTFETRLLLDSRLQSLACALMRNGLLRMRANEKPPTENTRSPSALLRHVLLIRC